MPYLIEELKTQGIIEPLGKSLWAAFDGIFVDPDFKPITTEDMALDASKYKTNVGGGKSDPKKPKQHPRIDKVIKKISEKG